MTPTTYHNGMSNQEQKTLIKDYFEELRKYLKANSNTGYSEAPGICNALGNVAGQHKFYSTNCIFNINRLFSEELLELMKTYRAGGGYLHWIIADWLYSEGKIPVGLDKETTVLQWVASHQEEILEFRLAIVHLMEEVCLSLDMDFSYTPLDI